MCGNWNQGNGEDEEDNLNEDRRNVVCNLNRKIGQMGFYENGPMTSEHLLEHSPLQNDHRHP